MHQITSSSSYLRNNVKHSLGLGLLELPTLQILRLMDPLKRLLKVVHADPVKWVSTKILTAKLKQIFKKSLLRLLKQFPYSNSSILYTPNSQ